MTIGIHETVRDAVRFVDGLSPADLQTAIKSGLLDRSYESRLPVKRREAVTHIAQWCVDVLEINGLSPRPVGHAYIEVIYEGHVIAIEVHGANKPWMFPRKGESNPCPKTATEVTL